MCCSESIVIHFSELPGLGLGCVVQRGAIVKNCHAFSVLLLHNGLGLGARGGEGVAMNIRVAGSCCKEVGKGYDDDMDEGVDSEENLLCSVQDTFQEQRISDIKSAQYFAWL